VNDMVALKQDLLTSGLSTQVGQHPTTEGLKLHGERLDTQRAGSLQYREQLAPKRKLADLAAASEEQHRAQQVRLEIIEENKIAEGAARPTELSAAAVKANLSLHTPVALVNRSTPPAQSESRPALADATAAPEAAAAPKQGMLSSVISTVKTTASLAWNVASGLGSQMLSGGRLVTEMGGALLSTVGGFICDAVGLTKIYEGVREGDWKKIAIGTAQLAGTAIACMTGAGLGVMIAGAVLANTGTIVSALSSGDPAAMAGAVLAVGLSVVLSKYGNVVAQKIMTKIAPVSQEVVKEGMLKVGEGLGKRVGAEIITDKGAERVTALGIEAGTKAAKTFSEQLESFAGPAIEAAKLKFGAAATEVGELAGEKAKELAVNSLTPEINAVMTKLGVTDRVAKVVRKELVEKASGAGILGQMGFGGGKVLSYLGLGNSSLRNSILAAAPELGEEGAKQLAKNLCRAVQQNAHTELVKESLSAGITGGLRTSLKEVLEDPMRDSFMKGIAPSIQQFAQRHGIEAFEHKMLAGARVGFDDAYGAVLAKHVRAGVDRAFAQKRGGGISRSTVPGVAVAAEKLNQAEGDPPTDETKAEEKRPNAAAQPEGEVLGSRTETVRVGNKSVTRTFERVRGVQGDQWHLVAESSVEEAAAQLERNKSANQEREHS
jgi:hypothetical protein